jgi:AraC family transcriptional regulator
VITSNVTSAKSATRDLQIAVRSFCGARAARIVGRGNTVGSEHSHDWPVLSLFIIGDYRKTFDGGKVAIRGPSVVLHGAGEVHANKLNEAGLEQLDLQFDPDWLGTSARKLKLDGVRCWLGGKVSAAGSELARLWTDPGQSEGALASATETFLRGALTSVPVRPPPWVERVIDRLDIADPPSARDLAAPIGLHPGWLAQAYRSATGEGILQTVQRRRVEKASSMLRGSDLDAAIIAAEAGFFDQSHMIRVFRRFLGRTPAQVRSERQLMQCSSGGDVR